MQKLYLDTNVFYFLFFENPKYHDNIVTLFKKIQSGEIKALTSSTTLQELAYISLMRLIEYKFEKHPSDVLRENPDVIAQLSPKIEDMFTTIFSFENLEIVDATQTDVSTIPFLMKKYLLLPQDALQVATMLRENCTRIVSTDSDFDTLPSIERLDPAKL